MIEIKKISAIEIKPFFDSLSQEELIDKEVLTEFLLKRVGVGFREEDFRISKNECLFRKGFKIKVWPDELARLLIFIYKHKEKINSFLEFGTGSGGTFFVIDSYLRAINPGMGKSVSIDKHRQKPTGIDDYQKRYPVECHNMTIQDFHIDQNYDLCFVDANHEYDRVKYDYEKVKNCSRFIVFHDILTVNKKKPDQRCVRHFWQELKADNKIEIITDDPRISFMSGIGIVWTELKI